MLLLLLLAVPARAAEISVEARALSTGAVTSLPSEQVGVLSDTEDVHGAALAGCEVREQARIEAKADYPGEEEDAMVAAIKGEAARRGCNAVGLERGGRYEDSGRLASVSATGYRIECEGGPLLASEIVASTSAWPAIAGRRRRKQLELNPLYARLKGLAAVAGCRWVRDRFSIREPALDECPDYSAAMASIVPSTAAVEALNAFFSVKFATGTLADFFSFVELSKGANPRAKLQMQLAVAESARILAAQLVASPDWPAFVRQYRAAFGGDPPDPVREFDKQVTKFEVTLESTE